MKVIMKCVNIKLWDILGCFHYILNAPRKAMNIISNVKVHLQTHSRNVNIFSYTFQTEF